MLSIQWSNFSQLVSGKEKYNLFQGSKTERREGRGRKCRMERRKERRAREREKEKEMALKRVPLMKKDL